MKQGKFLAFAIAFALLLSGAFATDYFVDGSLGTDDAAHGTLPGSGAWKTIGYAIGSASVGDGDAIYVAAGSYAEAVTIDKEIALIASGAVILDGTGISDTGVNVHASNVTVQGFIIYGFTQGIVVGYEATPPGDLQNVQILDNTIYDISHATHGFGIYVGYESEGFGVFFGAPNGRTELPDHLDYGGLVIDGNEVYNTDNAALALQSITATPPDAIRVSNNVFRDAGASGVWIDCGRNLEITGNIIKNNSNGIFFSGYPEPWYSEGGAYSPKDILISDNIIEDNVTGIATYMANSDAIDINDNSIQDNGTNVNHNLSGTLNMEDNWWGPGGPSGVNGNVDDEPWIGQGATASDGSNVGIGETPELSSGTLSMVEVKSNSSASTSTLFMYVVEGDLPQGYVGFAAGKAVRKRLIVITDFNDGEIVATLKIYFDAADLAAAAIPSGEWLSIYRWNPDTAMWELAGTSYQGDAAPTGVLGDFGIDTSGGYAWAVVDAFSEFAAGQDPTVPVELSVFSVE